MRPAPLFRGLVPALLVIGLSACASGPSAQSPGSDTGLDRMERLTLNANRCWFKSGDPAFADYSLAPELSSFSGKPRFLLVPKGKLEARPLLVVEGRSGSGHVDTYGPLLNEPVGSRLGADIRRWSGGDDRCTA
ncbi:hypothetical protein [Jiella marina]|uniref:hypothetical protein n=1 Tax=Jiella sp. LLJ827 TaxID=2917712 RepID=UPI002100E92A|nr:hypothetical protein [Jiella sp. LLJ827]MCQ0986731.1 hypothetical protein [Jiella sp. LLJ827]